MFCFLSYIDPRSFAPSGDIGFLVFSDGKNLDLDS
jgi:hypothetical protein